MPSDPPQVTPPRTPDPEDGISPGEPTGKDDSTEQDDSTTKDEQPGKDEQPESGDPRSTVQLEHGDEPRSEGGIAPEKTAPEETAPEESEEPVGGIGVPGGEGEQKVDDEQGDQQVDEAG